MTERHDCCKLVQAEAGVGAGASTLGNLRVTKLEAEACLTRAEVNMDGVHEFMVICII